MIGWHHQLNGHAAAAAAKSLQLCPTLSDPMDCSLQGSSIHEIFQARELEWGAVAFSGLWLYWHIKSIGLAVFRRTQRVIHFPFESLGRVLPYS